jgi:2-dehydropantoate 2-reductase
MTRSKQQCQSLRESGFSRSGIFGSRHVSADEIRVHDSLEDLARLEVDVWLVCTKATAGHEISAALGRIARELKSAPAIVLCQNGWGSAEVFSRHVPADNVFNARVITGFRRTGETEVEITVHAAPVRIGSLFGQSPESLAPLAQAIADGGLPCELTLEIERDLWAKVLYNCLLNPLGALLEVPYGELGRRHETRAIMAAIAREIFAVMERAGYETHWTRAEEYLETFFRELLPPTALHESSMLQDVRAGRLTEIQFLSGAVVQLGGRNDVPTPVNQALCELIAALSTRAPR